MAQGNKDVVRTLQKNYFWIATGLMVVLSLAVWWLSTAHLRSETTKRMEAIKGMESSVRTVANTPHHPNQHTQRHMEELIARLSEDVYDAWQQQYERQRALLTWPQILGQEFISIVTRLQPIEAKVKFGPDVKEELDITLRQRYRDFIDTELPKLADIIGAQWAASTSAARPRAQPLKPPIVNWSPSDQQAHQRLRFNWGGRFPTTLEVLYAQEDYWVLRSIMEIIKATNGDVEHRYQAAVKTIDFIDIGRTAISPAARGAMGGFLGGAGMGGGESDAAGGIVGGFPMSGMPGVSAGAGGGTAMVGGNEIARGGTLGPATVTPMSDPGDYRYVDLKFQPLTAQRIRSAFDSTNPDDAFLMVAKRIPVRIRVKVDQRKLPKLLAECGNARMQLEVKQVRINQAPGRGSSMSGGGPLGGGVGSTPPPPGEPTGMAGGGGGVDAGVSIPPGFGGASGSFFGGAENEPDAASGLSGAGFPSSMAPGPYGPNAPAGRSMAGQVLSDESPLDVDVELFGVIYIYNPVDRAKLGIKLEEVGEGASGQAPRSEANSDGAAPTSAG